MDIYSDFKGYCLKNVAFENVKIEDDFWRPRISTIREVTIKSCIKKCEDTGRISNFLKAAGKLEGKFEGIYFNDSDLYKVLEGSAYILANYPDSELEKRADELIDIIASAQQKDGYLVTYFILSKDEKRWTDMERHEDYCLGHMIEAAIAYKHATGKDKFLNTAIKMADHFDSIVGPGKMHWVPGHQEIELALVKLFHETGEERYLRLAEWLLEERGHGHGAGANLWGREEWGTKYAQDDKPISDMTDIAGHAVRAMYMYTGMADVAAITGDAGYLAALNRLWDSVVYRNMYITGGIGSSKDNEGFTGDYDLPNDTAYCETCASVGMVYWNHRMNLLYADSRYADIMELAMYNGVLSGLSFSGDKFFYVNPLETDGLHHREAWFDVSCCPTQLSRFVPSIGNYIYAVSKDGIFVNLYIQSKSAINLEGKEVRLTQKTEYPWDGKITLTVDQTAATNFEINLRYPAWCKAVAVSVNGTKISNLYIEKGYIKILRNWKAGDIITLDLDMPVEKVVSHPKVKMNAGKVAIKRGPLVYCSEETDNKDLFEEIAINSNALFFLESKPDILNGIKIIKAKLPDNAAVLTAVPYYAWDNREPGHMKVWINEVE